MRFLERGARSGEGKYLTFFVVGLFAGFFILNIGKSILLDGTGLFDEYTLYQMKYMTVDSSALFCYVFRRRIIWVLGVALAATTYLGPAACVGSTLWYGMSAGVFLASLAVRYGLKGIMLAVLCVFPQYLLYIPAALALFAWCEGIFRGTRFQEGDRSTVMRKAGQLAGVCLVVTAGCLLEGYLNPYLLLGYLKIF